MRILQNATVRRQEWNVIDTGCGNDHLIRWIAVKDAWKLRRLDRNARR
jgi:hypothetical protein